MITDTLACTESPAWMESANCRSTDPDVFFPSATGKWNRVTMNAAFSVCRRCPVSVKCLAWALEIDDMHGILGGTTPDMRRNMVRKAAALWNLLSGCGCWVR